MYRIATCSLLCLLTTGSPIALAEGQSEDAKPSAEMLEFLAEFEDVDDETFDMLLAHGLRDLREDEENRDEDD